MDSRPEQIRAEIENVEETIRNLDEAMSRKEKTVVELAAIAAFLHNFYNGVENILKQHLGLRNIRIPKSENWHKDLLNQAAANGIVTSNLCDELYEYLSFRHFFVHAYGFMLEEAHLEVLAEHVPDVWKQFLAETKKGIPHSNRTENTVKPLANL